MIRVKLTTAKSDFGVLILSKPAGYTISAHVTFAPPVHKRRAPLSCDVPSISARVRQGEQPSTKRPGCGLENQYVFVVRMTTAGQSAMNPGLFTFRVLDLFQEIRSSVTLILPLWITDSDLHVY
jgi:hypothetical protein